MMAPAPPDESHLADIVAIHQLKARYFRLMDTKQWDEMAQVFTDDVVIDMTGEGAGTSVGVTDFMTMLTASIGDVITVHHGHMPEITITGPDSAEGIWAMEDQLFWPEGSPLRSLHGYGHYHETYRREADGWRIATVRLTRLHRIIQMAD